MIKILIVDDDDMVRLALSENMKDGGFYPIEASNGLEAIDIFKKEKPASVLLDLKMPGMDGMQTMRKLKEIDPDIPVIINTAYGDIQTAVNAIKLGAYDFVVKPPDFDRLILTLKRASEKFELSQKVKTLHNKIQSSLEYLLGKSTAMKKVNQQIHQISQSDFSLIIQGETGTGKSFIARTIHNLSPRANGPFITVDIGSIPESLVESELFGHEKGAFTGADKKKKGFFEIAKGGTILIDELQNISPYVQSKLLTAVEERKIYSLGSTTPIDIDVRIIGATNSDIIQAVKKKKSFREDLFYRLSEFIIILPPLREREKDLLFYADKFFIEATEDLNKPVHLISDHAFSLLTSHSWPGNIRELKNVIRRAVLLSDSDTITPEHIEFIGNDMDELQEKEATVTPEKIQGLSMTEVEKVAIKNTLSLTNGNKSKAASILQIDYTTLLRKIKQYCI